MPAHGNGPRRAGHAPHMRLLIVVNPISGRGRSGTLAERLAASVRTRAGVTVGIETSAAPGEIESRLAGWIDAHAATCVVLVGGDGTIHEAVQALAERPSTPWSVLPAGTGNTLAAEYGLTPDPERLAAALVADVADRGETSEAAAIRRRIPIARVEVATGPRRDDSSDLDRPAPRRFVLFAGFGVDATAIRSLEAARSGRALHAGRLAWARALCRVWLAFRRPTTWRTGSGAVGEQFLATLVRSYGGVLTLPFDARAASDLVVLRARIRHRLTAFWLGVCAISGPSFLRRLTRVAIEHHERFVLRVESRGACGLDVQLDGSAWLGPERIGALTDPVFEIAVEVETTLIVARR
jgi:diacylglycerol kinase family enzyme